MPARTHKTFGQIGFRNPKRRHPLSQLKCFFGSYRERAHDATVEQPYSLSNVRWVIPVQDLKPLARLAPRISVGQ